MPEPTADDLARIRRAVLFRDRCREAAVADGKRLDLPVSPVQANVAYDAFAHIIRADERRRVAAHLAEVQEASAVLARVQRFIAEHGGGDG